jgi:C4-dicarboxylate transporter, DctM subunit
MTKKEITYIARVTLPFFFLMMVMVLLLWFVPQVATYLPQKMGG